MDYCYRSTRQFDKDIVKLLRGNAKLNKKIEAALATIRSEPKQSIKDVAYKLHSKLEGQRVYKVAINTLLRYAICSECKHAGARLNCADCRDTPNNTITMVSAGDHNHVLYRG
jgi:mRNA-degrading endonuclease YafQ of YafQ-DinJ toxin-antitoxin module